MTGGFSAVLLFCMWIAARPKPGSEALEFTALSAGGDTAKRRESVNKELLDKVFRAYGDGKLFCSNCQPPNIRRVTEMKVSIKDISEPFDHKRSDLWSAIFKAANTASDAGMDVKEIIDLIGKL